jgi:tetratricopeptide (TPR) repeat protein
MRPPALLLLISACLLVPTGCTVAATPRAGAAHVESAAARLVARGKAFAQAGDLTRAAQYFDAALGEGASPSTVVPLLMGAYVRSRRYRMAVERGELYLIEHPGDGRMRFLVATLHAAIGNSGLAITHLQRLVRERPDHASAHHALAVLLRDAGGDPVQAATHFRRYLELSPRGAHADEARGWLSGSPP